MRITARKPRWLAALLALAWMGGTSLQAAPAPQGRAQLTALDNRPLAFEENRGQTDPQVKYLSRGQRYTLFLTPAEAVLALHGAGRNQAGSVLRIRWAGGAAAPRMTADAPLPGVRERHEITSSPQDMLQRYYGTLAGECKRERRYGAGSNFSFRTLMRRLVA